MKPNLDFYSFPLKTPTMWGVPYVQFVSVRLNSDYAAMQTADLSRRHICTMFTGYLVAGIGGPAKHYYPT